MIRTYTLRLKPTKRQRESLTDLLEHLCVLYNSSLEYRKRSWEENKKAIGYKDQQKALAVFRQKSPSVSVFPAAIQRDPLRRVDRAYQAFFRRVKSSEKPGYPRFKAKTQYNSFEVDSQNFYINSNTIIICKMGGFRFKTHYKIKGNPKVLNVSRRGKHWIANLVCDLGPAPEKVTVSSAVGIDLGLTALATLSDGSEIANPRWTKQEEDRLAEANRDLARRTKGSKNRKKSKDRLRRVHQRIAGKRSAYVMAVAKQLFEKYDLIAHEKLNIRGMVQSNLAKSINDAAWGNLIWRLTCEAEKAGKWLVPVNPRNTTTMCSGCGELVPKTLAQRTHFCPSCGLVLGRDHNAALNILRLGESLASEQNCMLIPVGDSCI
jgi:putative transposase